MIQVHNIFCEVLKNIRVENSFLILYHDFWEALLLFFADKPWNASFREMSFSFVLTWIGKRVASEWEQADIFIPGRSIFPTFGFSIFFPHVLTFPPVYFYQISVARCPPYCLCSSFISLINNFLVIICSSQAIHPTLQHEATHQNAQVTNPPSSHKTWFDFVWSGLKACHTESRPLNTSRTTPRSLQSTPISSTKSEVLKEVIKRNYDSVLLIWCLLGKRHFLKRGKRCCPCTKKLAAKSFDVASWCWFSKKALKWPKYVKTLLRECIIPPNPGTELDFKEIFSQFGRF